MSDTIKNRQQMEFKMFLDGSMKTSDDDDVSPDVALTHSAPDKRLDLFGESKNPRVGDEFVS